MGVENTIARSSAGSSVPAYRDGNVLRWLTAYAASVLGSSVFFLALAWSATRVTGPAQVGLVLAIGALPRAALMLVGGVVADRFGPRRVVIVSDGARCLVCLVAALALALASPGLWLLVVVAFVFGVLDALFMPAVGALPPHITAADQLARVQGMRTLAMRLGNIAGPAAGGVAVAMGGPAAAFAVAAMLLVISLVLLVTVRTARPHPFEAGGAESSSTSPWRDLAAGVRYIRGHRVLAPLIVVAAVGELGFIGPLNVGLVLLAGERGWGASGMGLIIGAFAAGAGVSAVLLTIRGHVPRAGQVSGWCLLVSSGAVAMLGAVPTLSAAVTVGAVIGLFAGVSSAVFAALIQTCADSAYLGRVSAVMTLVTIGLAPLSYPATGAAVGIFGPEAVFAASGVICAAAAVLCLVIRPLRRAELAGKQRPSSGEGHRDRSPTAVSGDS